MARGPSRRIATVLIFLAVTGCTTGAARPATTSTAHAPTSTSTASTTSTTSTTTTIVAPATTASSPPGSTTVPLEIDAETRVPEGEGPFPAVVLVHGGGWVAGTPSVMDPLARHLTENGFLTVNTRYRLSSLDVPGFPHAVDDVACAVRFAAAHPDSDGTVAVIGHSAGAHIGAIVALDGEEYGGICPVTGPGVPNDFIGLAGPYDVERIGLPMLVFFGAGPDLDPEAWAAGNPQGLTDENTDLDSLIMYGELDGIVDDSFAFNFHEALLESGSTSLLEEVEGARHNDMHDPALVGDLIVTWLER